MKKTNLKKILSILLAVAILLSVMVPALSIFVSATTVVDTTSTAFISGFTVNNSTGTMKKGEATGLTITVADPRVKYDASTPAQPTDVIVTPISNGFTFNGAPTVAIQNSSTEMNYTLNFPSVTYNGGATELSFNVNYTDGGVAVPVPLATLTYNVTQIAADVVETQDTIIDDSKSVFIQNYVIMDQSGIELTTVNPGQNVKVAFSVVDNRITYTTAPQNIRARMAQGSFVNNDAGNVSWSVKSVGTVNGRNILGYSIVFHNVTYNGGTPEIAFDVSYINKDANGYEVPLAVPYTQLKQTITQAVDDVPEPKVILNSANYGGVAYVGQNFTLSTVATNTSDYVDLENVSVKVELPTGIAMSSGNSQALIGNVAKKGTISHNFNLVVTGVENNVTNLPVKIVYEFDAYVKGQRKTYTTEQSIAINIEQETKFIISNMDYMETVSTGEEAGITVYLINKGKTTVNNVTVEIESNKVNGPQTVFVGNIAPGSENTADIYFMINEAGTTAGKIIVTYEDAKGKQSTLEKEFSIEAMEATFPEWDIPTDVMPPQPESKSKWPWIVGTVIVVGAGGAGAFFIIKKRKALKEAEGEDEDI